MDTGYRQFSSQSEKKKLLFRYYHYMGRAMRAQKRGNQDDFDQYYQYAEYYLKRANGFSDPLPAVPPQFPSYASEAANQCKDPSGTANPWLLPQRWDPQNRRHVSCNALH